jgi:hypothetical protein
MNTETVESEDFDWSETYLWSVGAVNGFNSETTFVRYMTDQKIMQTMPETLAANL